MLLFCHYRCLLSVYRVLLVFILGIPESSRNHAVFAPKHTESFNAFHFFFSFRPCYSVFLGYVIFSSFVTGCAVVIVALQQKHNLSLTFHRINEHLGLIAEPKVQPTDCNVCGQVKCNRHSAAPNREPWRGLFITRGLDTALDSVREAFELLVFSHSIVAKVTRNGNYLASSTMLPLSNRVLEVYYNENNKNSFPVLHEDTQCIRRKLVFAAVEERRLCHCIEAYFTRSNKSAYTEIRRGTNSST